MTGSGEKMFEAEGPVRNFLVFDCYLHDVGKAFEATTNILDFYVQNGAPDMEMHDGIAIVDTDAHRGDFGQLGMVASRRLIFMGNDWEKPASHTLRVMHAAKAVISHSRIANASQSAPSTVELKLHGTSWSGSKVAPHTYTEDVVISDNIFESNSSAWQAVLGPQSGNDTDERLRNILVERNQFRAGVTSQLLLKVASLDATVRNNIFDLSTGSYITGVRIARHSIEPPPDRCVVANNTFYRSDEGEFEAINVGTGALNTTVKNNLGFAPEVNDPEMVSDSGTGTIAKRNELTDLTSWVNDNPVEPEHFMLNANSPAIDRGVEVPCVLADFNGKPAPVDGDGSGTAELDLGAFEY
jgi:hypothetical protein